jgi:hypothetical protein
MTALVVDAGTRLPLVTERIAWLAEHVGDGDLYPGMRTRPDGQLWTRIAGRAQ